MRKPDGEAIRERREDAWLQQEELAQMAGVSRNTIIDLEKNRRPKAHKSTLLRIARALDVDPNELLEGRDGSGPLGLRHPQTHEGLLTLRAC